MTDRRRPTVFDVDDVSFDDDADVFAPPPRRGAAQPPREDDEPVAGPAPKRAKGGFSWFGLFLAGLGALSGLALSIAVAAFVEDLFARTPLLGSLALVLAVAMGLGLLGMVAKEWFAVRRLKAVESLRARADNACADDDREAAFEVLSDLNALYEERPETAAGRAALKAHMREIIDGRDLVALGEREVLAPLDAEARRLIVGSARRVTAVTALSPRALVDVLYVLFESVTLVRRIALVYGGRPGTLGFFRVLRHAVGHLAVTGGMAVGDSLVGEVIGNSIAAKLSARLGEGLVNGLMTARLGLAALDVMRPLPFVETRRPRMNDILQEIARLAPKDREA